MRILGQIDGVYFFAPRKKEDTATAIEKITEVMQCDFSYIGIVSADDFRKNGYHEEVERIAGKIDFTTHNLIIVKKT